MGEVIGITAQKGGVGKTMTAINLSAGLASKGRSVLVIDTDPQSPIAKKFDITPPDDLLPIAYALKQRQLNKIILKSPRFDGLSVAPGDVSLDDKALSTERFRDTIFEKAIQPVRDEFDYILIDTPPTLDLVTTNAMVAADWLILPTDVDADSLQSLRRTLDVAFEFFSERESGYDPETFYRILVNLYNPKTKIMNRWLDKQLAPQEKRMFQTKIRIADALKKARAEEMTIFDYRKKKLVTGRETRNAVDDYNNLTEEVIAHGSRNQRSGKLANA